MVSNEDSLLGYRITFTQSQVCTSGVKVHTWITEMPHAKNSAQSAARSTVASPSQSCEYPNKARSCKLIMAYGITPAAPALEHHADSLDLVRLRAFKTAEVGGASGGRWWRATPCSGRSSAGCCPGCSPGSSQGCCPSSRWRSVLQCTPGGRPISTVYWYSSSPPSSGSTTCQQ